MRTLIAILGIFLCIFNLNGQNIGINTSDPKETIHMQMDTQNVVLRFDNRKSDVTGTVDTIIRCAPSNISQISGPNTVPWQSFNLTDIQTSDDIYATSGTLFINDKTASLEVTFNCDQNIPSDVTINTITLDSEIGAIYNDPLSLSSLTIIGYSYRGSIQNSAFIIGLLAPLLADTPFTFLVANQGDYTPLEINTNQFRIQYEFDPSGQDVNVLIDQLEIEVNYTYPATGTEEVRWTAGVQNGKFNISKSPSITNNQYLSISELGQTRLKSLQITDNAADGKILASAIDGTALWRFPFELGLGSNLIWSQSIDTAIYDQGPVKIQNNDELALSFNSGRSRLQNSDNLLVLENSKLNFLIDTENASNDDVFAIYNDKEDASNAPIVKFHLEGDNSWINSGDLGLRTNNPNTDLHLVHGPASESDGFKIQQQGTNQFWRFHTSAGGQLLLMNTGSPNVPIGSFSPVNGAYTALSDERAKSNIRNLGNVLPALRMVEPVRYGFNHWPGDEESIGFIAQDVIKYFPEVVTYHPDMDRYTMDYSAFGVIAIQAIKELDARVTKLEKMVAKLGEE